jgi:hypothetical protein
MRFRVSRKGNAIHMWLGGGLQRVLTTHLCCQEVAHEWERMFVRLTYRPRCIASHDEHFLQAASSYPGSQLSSVRRPVDTASRQVGNGSVAVRQE